MAFAAKTNKRIAAKQLQMSDAENLEDLLKNRNYRTIY